MKEFDYELAKKGRPVKTRDGRPARIISFDCKDVVRPIVALVETEPNKEEVLMYSPSGKTDITEPGLDLVMRSEKHEGWVNITNEINGTWRITPGPLPTIGGRIYNTKELAEKFSSSNESIAKIEWED